MICVTFKYTWLDCGHRQDCSTLMNRNGMMLMLMMLMLFVYDSVYSMVAELPVVLLGMMQ